MGKQASPYSLRVDSAIMGKLKALSKLNDRSLNGQIENILKKYVADYEKANGPIPIPDLDAAE